jgi:signal transduction histidine kinase
MHPFTVHAPAENDSNSGNAGARDETGQKELLRKEAISTSRSVPIRDSGPSSIFHVGGNPAAKQTIDLAVREAFPRAEINEYSSVGDLITSGQKPISKGGMLVLSGSDETMRTQMQNELDESGLPRWALVMIAEPTTGSTAFNDVIRSSDLTTSVMTQVLRSAWERHLLRRDNQRLRGTLLAFGSRIAHDLRTPLGGVLTTTEMLREVLAEDAPADVPLTQPILDSTEGLVKLIERSSFFARATGSREPAKTLDMGVPFWNAYQRLERLMLKAKMSLKHPTVWPKVSGQETSFETIWNILLNNAVQHSAPGTELEAGWSAVEGGRRFWVRSEGQVPAEKRATLFFPFHRLAEPGAPRGLGLPMMRGLVEMAGGACGFQEATAGRVDFYFELPAPLDTELSSGPPRAAV